MIDGTKIDDKGYFMAIQDFSYEMFKTMVTPKNKEKGGWWDCDMDYLIKRLKEEVDELENEVKRQDQASAFNVTKEATDVANFALMVQDQYRRDMSRKYSTRYPD
jgi:NTP pyrophosphatase (non-canonical NTP hydrolase)